jgi:putative hemolysin
MKMKIKKKLSIIPLIVVALVLLAGVAVYFSKTRQDKFAAPRQEAPIIQYRIGKEATLMGVVSNLHYYGFIKDEDAFKYALGHAKDATPGQEDAIKIGSNTINTQTTYEISQTMDAWQLADVLLNKGRFDDCSHGCPGMFYPELLPGGDLAPSVNDRFKWVETYEGCVKAGGQLSSEQYSQRTGEPRKCVTPDGREFTQGKEGWTEFRGG